MLPTRRALLGSAMAMGAGLALPRTVRAARVPNTLVFGLSSYPPNLQAFAPAGTAALTVKLQTHRGLLSYDAAGKVRAELAESWEPQGPTGWRFKLREAVFHNGKPVTAEDVRWTLEQVAAERSVSPFAGQFREIERVETPDARTVIVVMKEPTIVLPEWLAHPHVPIVAKDSLGRDGVGIGAGPYTVKAQERGTSVDLEANPRFYRPGLPKIRNLRFVAYADENLRVAALRAGDVDIIEYVPWEAMASIEADPQLKLDNQNGPFMWMGFNGARKPFDNPLVRQACAYAIRREEIVQAVFFGRGAPLAGVPLIDSSPFFDAARSRHFAHDPGKAKALLSQAGLADGFSAQLLSTAQYGMHKSTAEIVQQHLAEIGVKVELSMPDWATRVARGGRGQYDFFIQGSTADNNDPDGLSTLLDGTLPPSTVRSMNIPTPEVHQLFAEGRREFDAAKRKEIYARLEAQALQDCALVGLAWRAQGYAMAKDVQGFRGLPGGLNFNSGITLEDVTLG
ncbi:ABC transporter substrate-binding protein [Roseomonas sp. OT10]|uniref:ABC transporter substrate-binding protein n=1 Tax=Roseomonas cutis TaxID=2897332 RepID=UPI001E34AB9F|nr:ABC transporter substrate-binding protein [Roseomonas sp. OT10]UFN48856.1 ABC transporter substrate-binding protein [Roseomonas sp. OT10]